MQEQELHDLHIAPEEFLSPFFEADETVCLRVLADRPGSSFSGVKQEVILKDFTEDENADLLKRHNAQNRGIFFVVNHGGHEDADISRVNAQFVEMDDVPFDQQLARVRAFALPPSLIVKTRKSLHCYWLIKKGETKSFRRIQRRLVVQFHGDPACINASRVMRLPGYYHCKSDPVMVQCVKFNPELRYTQAELEALLPAVPDDEASAPGPSPLTRQRGTQKGLHMVGKRCNFIKHCAKNAKALPEPDWYAMITNLALFEEGEAAIHKLSRPYPNSICWEMHQMADDILNDRKRDRTFYPVIYSAPEEADWTDPEVWKACNPSLGITVKQEPSHSSWPSTRPSATKRRGSAGFAL